jgi:cyanate lyase
MEHMNVASLIKASLNRSGKSIEQVAEESGMNKLCLKMVSAGITKLPIDRVEPLSRALQLDTARMLWMVMTEYTPETVATIERTIGRTAMFPNGER